GATAGGRGEVIWVVSGAGAVPAGYYDEVLAGRIEALPALSEALDASGHLQISQELVIAQSPDLVLGLTDGVTREALADAGAQVVVQDVDCGTDGERARFETLHATIAEYGRHFDRGAHADALPSSLQEPV